MCCDINRDNFMVDFHAMQSREFQETFPKLAVDVKKLLF